MPTLESAIIHCPCCGEEIELLVDCSLTYQEYVEDCSVCCRPIVVTAYLSEEGHLRVDGRSEDE